MDQRRLLIASAISLLLIIAYDELVLRPYRARQPTAPAPAASKEASAPEPRPELTSDLAADPGPGGFVIVETDLFRVSITPVGARVVDLELKGYRRSVESAERTRFA